MKYLFLILIGLSQCSIDRVHASGKHEHHTTTNVYTQYVTQDGLALAMAAAGISTDWTTQKLQIAVSGGTMDSEQAGMVAIAKRFCSDCPLLQGTLGRVDGKTGLGVSALWVIE